MTSKAVTPMKANGLLLVRNVLRTYPCGFPAVVSRSTLRGDTRKNAVPTAISSVTGFLVSSTSPVSRGP